MDKANNKKRLLIYDGYNSYILTEFIHYCINNILILLLIPHSFHLIQPLNIGIFEPLKYIISFQLDPIFRTGVYCLHKVKWMKSYIKARKIDITPSNVLGGWRGAGLFPLNKHRILHQLSDNHSKSIPSMEYITLTQFLSTGSPPDYNTLQSTNTAFNMALSQTTAPSPVKTHGQCLTEIILRLTAENTILQKDNSELRAQISKQKERVKGKYFVLKDKYVISTEEIYKVIDSCEKMT